MYLLADTGGGGNGRCCTEVLLPSVE